MLLLMTCSNLVKATIHFEIPIYWVEGSFSYEPTGTGAGYISCLNTGNCGVLDGTHGDWRFTHDGTTWVLTMAPPIHIVGETDDYPIVSLPIFQVSEN